MSKLLLLSIIFATIAIPARARTVKNQRAGFKKVIVEMLIFEAFYLFVLCFLYGRV